MVVEEGHKSQAAWNVVDSYICEGFSTMLFHISTHSSQVCMHTPSTLTIFSFFFFFNCVVTHRYTGS